MESHDDRFLKDFYRQVMDRPLDPASDKRYVPLYEGPHAIGDDPVRRLEQAIRWLPGESVQLVSGSRGTGKSTELRRLRSALQARGYLVVLIDIEDYINTTTRIDLSDFLISVAGAFGEAMAAPEMLGNNPFQQGYWERLWDFLTKTNTPYLISLLWASRST